METYGLPPAPGEDKLPELTDVHDVLFRLSAREVSARPRMGREYTAADAHRVLTHVGRDVETAVDAMAMVPWPRWMREVILEP